MQARLIVAYDDDPCRYDHFAKLVAPLGLTLVCIEHPDALRQLLDRADVRCVLMDHDLRDLCGEPITGLQVTQEHLTCRPDVPVIVTSANRAGAANIARALSDAGHGLFSVISVIDIHPEQRWLGQLVEWGVLG